jgi:hypothetical protein
MSTVAQIALGIVLGAALIVLVALFALWLDEQLIRRRRRLQGQTDREVEFNLAPTPTIFASPQIAPRNGGQPSEDKDPAK